KTAWQKLKSELKLQYRLHDTRHTVATALAVAGVPEAKRRHLMGHVDENVIKRYTHLEAEDCRADLERALARRWSAAAPLVSTENSTAVPPVSTPVNAQKPEVSLQ